MDPAVLAWAMAQPAGSRAAVLANAHTGGTTRVTFDGRTIVAFGGGVAAIRAAYAAEYARFYDRPVPGSDVEVMSFAVVMSTVREMVEPVAEPAGAPAPAVLRHQAVRGTAPGAMADWAV